jgi:hypothetical protein
MREGREREGKGRERQTGRREKEMPTCAVFSVSEKILFE